LTTTRNKRRRNIASGSAYELSPATRRQELGEKPALEGERTSHRFDAADLAVLEPCAAAIELAECLGKPDGFLADYRAAARPEGKLQLIEEERAGLSDLKKSRDHSPAQREDLVSAFFREVRAERKRIRHQCRVNAKRWISLVRMYELHRAWLHTLPPSIRVKKVWELRDGVVRAASNDLQSFNREEARRRARNRKDIRQAARRNRRAFGHKKKTDGWNSKGRHDQSYRRPAVPMTPDGEVDVEELKRAELLLMFATWEGSRVNSGIGIAQGTIEEEGDQWSVTEDNRLALRLTKQAQEFKNWKRDRSI